MTETHLAALVAQGESDTLEFKKTTAEREAALRTVCALLNGSGGRVLIRVKASRDTFVARSFRMRR